MAHSHPWYQWRSSFWCQHCSFFVFRALCTLIHAAINRWTWFIHFFIKSCFQSYWPLTASLYSILEGSTTKPWKTAKEPDLEHAIILQARLFWPWNTTFGWFVPYDHVIWKHHTTSFWCMTKAFNGDVEGSHNHSKIIIFSRLHDNRVIWLSFMFIYAWSCDPKSGIRCSAIM